MKAAEHLRQQNAVILDGLLWHPFFLLVAEGTLPNAARDAYFIYEHRFVEQAVTIFAHILTKAPTPGARAHLVHILNGLVNDQQQIFDRTFAQIGPRANVEPPQAVNDLCNGMTRIAADGSYAQGLAAMLAAEWTYANVSRRILDSSVRDPLLRDWFALHVAQPFVQGVNWLEAEIEAQAAQTGLKPLVAAFRKAILLEIAFHTAPLDQSTRSDDSDAFGSPRNHTR